MRGRKSKLVVDRYIVQCRHNSVTKQKPNNKTKPNKNHTSKANQNTQHKANRAGEKWPVDQLYDLGNE